MSRKQIKSNTGQEQRYPLDDPEARLTYKNTEGYADPTCFYALCNVLREKKKQHRSRDQPRKQKRKWAKKRHNTQVIHYDERGKEI